ncbi:MAG: carbonic anhydrase [Anaerolineae bacterium]|jgi:carbonic anhydrase
MPTAKILGGIGFFQSHFLDNLDLFERLATEGQSPEVLWFGCSDSRVVPELITGAEPGDLFVTRNVANIVPPYGTGEMGVGAVVEYAVLHLHVAHVVVCGHTDCGGIKALDAQLDLSREPHIARWLEHARPAQTKVEASGLPEEERHLATVRENVLLQLEHLRSYDPVRDAERVGSLTLHAWVYHLETGIVEAHDAQTGAWSALESERLATVH